MRNRRPEIYRERIPARRGELKWQEDERGRVVLELVRRGVVRRAAGWLWGSPRRTYLHLDSIGSFVWLEMDGTLSMTALCERLENAFGERVSPTYDRLVIFARMMEARGLIEWK